MKLFIVAATLPFLTYASLNCTVITPTVTHRYREFEGCQPYATATAGQIIHAKCRADCSTEKEPWFQLYDGSFIKAANETVKGCRYHYKPYEVMRLPNCHQERGNVTDASLAPTVCPMSMSSGIASKIPAPKTLDIEPVPFLSIISLCSLEGAQALTAPPRPWAAEKRILVGGMPRYGPVYRVFNESNRALLLKFLTMRTQV